MRRLSLVVFLVLMIGPAFTQAPKVWWVYFSDKQGSTFDPYQFFDPAAIERREKNGVSLYDSSDFPVSPQYLAKVESVVDTLGYASRWMNAVSVVATDDEINRIQQFSFVKSTTLQNGFEWVPTSTGNSSPVTDGSALPLATQVRELQGDVFDAHGINGKGINICILDAGFWGVNTHEAFADLRFNNQITATKNFISSDTNIYKTKTDHGTEVLSCIAGHDPTQKLGLAMGANFLLGLIAKEYGNQYRAEEHYIAGVEWADQKGAQIINISGGPNENAYFAEQMDGKTTVISFACKMAARKGILVVAAAGNNGEHKENQLLPPAETDSVLSVTALGDSGFVASYSAIGPPPDFRRKPDVCAPGDVLAAAQDKKGNEYAYSDGTSFSAPLVVGFAACLMQLHPEITAMGALDSICHSGNHYPYYDYAHGYGIPQAGYFYRQNYVPVKSFSLTKQDTSIVFTVEPGADTLCAHIEDRLLFYNITDANGRIVNYWVCDVTQRNFPLQICSGTLANRGYKLTAWYKNYYAEINL